MNKSYRSIWNEALGAWVAASENASGRKKSGGVRLARAACLVATAALAGALAGPAGAQSVGTGAATGTGSTAVSGGAAATASGEAAIAIGNGALAAQNGSGGGAAAIAGGIAIGANASAGLATAGSTIAIGARSVASTPNTLGDSLAIGTDSKAIGQDSVAIGGQVTASGTYSVAVGNDGTTASGATSSAFGTGAVASANRSTALGTDAVANVNTGDVALGAGSVTGAVAGTASHVINGTAYSFAGATPTSTVSVGAVGAERTITNVAAGRISVGSTDAVNGSQLYSTNQALEGLTTTVAASKTRYYSVNSTGGTNELNEGATGADAIASGKNAVASGAGAYAAGLGSNAASDGSIALGWNAKAIDGGLVAIGVGAQSLAQNTIAIGGTASVRLGIAIGFASNSAGNGAVAIGDATTSSNFSTVALGQSAVATGLMAIGIGRQANASGVRSTALGALSSSTVEGGVALGALSVSDRVIAGTQGDIPSGNNFLVPYNTTDRTLLGAVSVGNATTYRQITNVADGTEQQDAVTVRQLTGAMQSFAVSPTKYFHANSSATDSLAAGAESVAIGPQTIVNSDNGIGIGNGATVQVSAPGGTAIGQGATSSAADSVALGTKASAAATQGVAIGAGSSVSQAGGVALGAASVASTAAGVAGYVPVGASQGQTAAVIGTTSTLAAVSVGDAANGQYRQITGVAAGAVDSDAVNVSQLKAVQTSVTSIDNSAVKYENNVDGSVNYNSVALGNNNSTGPVALHNVAAGVAGTDAVNVNQLNAGVTSANQYTDAKFGQIRGDLNRLAKDASAGTAGAIAMANLPQAYLPGKSMASVGVGGFDGEAAVALGVSKLSDNGRWVVKFSGTANSRGKVGVGAGAGFHW